MQENTIQKSVYDYSTINTMGDLAVNRKFKKGYDDLLNNQHTKDIICEDWIQL